MIKRAPGGTGMAHSMLLSNTTSEGYIISACNSINGFILKNDKDMNTSEKVEYFVMENNYAIFYNKDEIISGTFFDIEKMRIESWNKLHKKIIEQLICRGVKIENNDYYERWYKE